jgi:hypothetical protein
MYGTDTLEAHLGGAPWSRTRPPLALTYLVYNGFEYTLIVSFQ